MKQPHMTQAPTASGSPLHLVYGRPPLGLADVLPSAVQVSPLIPGSPAMEEIADASGQVSDRLALRHFAHVDDVSQRTVSV